MTIYTYTPDLMRPLCPICGAPVPQDTDTPETPWQGTCPAGHSHTFQLEDDEQEQPDDHPGVSAFSGSAGELVSAYGARLVGQRIDTARKATYPGGVAEVLQLTPDANAPEICLQVRHCATGEVIGIFQDERVRTAF